MIFELYTFFRSFCSSTVRCGERSRFDLFKNSTMYLPLSSIEYTLSVRLMYPVWIALSIIPDRVASVPISQPLSNALYSSSSVSVTFLNGWTIQLPRLSTVYGLGGCVFFSTGLKSTSKV